nr:MAG TPA: hypothetical protein [Caudoviricetes sp.]
MLLCCPMCSVPKIMVTTLLWICLLVVLVT